MKERYLWGGLILGYVITRVLYLHNIPIFNDESIFIRYGMHQLFEKDHRFYSLLADREPLMPFLYAFIGTMSRHLLIGARMVTVVSGLLALIGLILVAKMIGNTRTAVISAISYILAPYFVFLDRLAIMDSSINAICVWSLYFTYKIISTRKYIYAVILGVTVGIGLWIKSTALFFLILPIIVFILYSFKNEKTRICLFKLFSASTVISLIIYEPLYFNPLFAVHKGLMQVHTYPLFSVFKFPVIIWVKNLYVSLQLLLFSLTPFIFIPAVIGVWIFRKTKKFRLVYLWLFPPLLYIVLYAKLLTGRYTLVLCIPLILFSSYFIDKLFMKKSFVAYLLLAFFAVYSLSLYGVLLFKAQTYPFLFAGAAQRDLKQYFYGFPSGYGVQEAITYLQKKAAKKKITVLVRDDNGNPEDAVFAYLYYDPRVQVIPFINFEEQKQEIKKMAKTKDIYYVSRGGYFAGVDKYFLAGKKFLKPNDTEFVGVYKISW